jgi:hypothetical protein
MRSAHEVHIDEEQMAWFERKLAEARGRPVLVMTHAPPMGSGLKVCFCQCVCGMPCASRSPSMGSRAPRRVSISWSGAPGCGP